MIAISMLSMWRHMKNDRPRNSKIKIGHIGSAK